MSKSFKDEINALQLDYIEGSGIHGNVHTQYSRLLKQYKDAYKGFSMPHELSKIGALQSIDEDNKSSFIADIVFFVLGLLCFNSSRFFLCVLYAVLAITKYILVDEVIWMVPFAVTVIVAFISFIFRNDSSYLLFFYLVPLAAQILKLVVERWKNTNSNKSVLERTKKKIYELAQKDKQLDEIREQMSELIPTLKKELLFNMGNIANSDSEKEFVKSLGEVMPEQFWWNNRIIYLFERFYKYESDIYYNFPLRAQELKVFQRSVSDAFKGIDNDYAPLFSCDLVEREMKEYYSYNIQRAKEYGGIVVDVIAAYHNDKFIDITGEETIYDKSYLERKFETSEWEETGRKIKDAYIKGEISQSDYSTLSNEYDMADKSVRDSINSSKTEMRTTRKLVTNTELGWTGQFILIPDPDTNGQSYIMLDYRCRVEYLYENINMISNYKISKVCFDAVKGNNILWAKLLQCFGKGQFELRAIPVLSI